MAGTPFEKKVTSELHSGNPGAGTHLNKHEFTNLHFMTYQPYHPTQPTRWGPSSQVRLGHISNFHSMWGIKGKRRLQKPGKVALTLALPLFFCFWQLFVTSIYTSAVFWVFVIVVHWLLHLISCSSAKWWDLAWPCPKGSLVALWLGWSQLP